MKFENPNNFIKPETDNAEITKQETGDVESAKNKTEEEKNIEETAIERVEKEAEEIGGVKEEGKKRFLKKAMKNGLIGISIALSSMIATEAMASGLSNVGEEPSATIEKIQKNVEKQGKDFKENEMSQEAPIRDNLERAKIIHEQMESFRNSLFKENSGGMLGMGVNRMWANEIIKDIQSKHFLYLRDAFSKENYRQYLNKMNQKYNHVFDTENILNLKEEAK